MSCCSVTALGNRQLNRLVVVAAAAAAVGVCTGAALVGSTITFRSTVPNVADIRSVDLVPCATASAAFAGNATWPL